MRLLIDGTDYDIDTDIQGDIVVEHRIEDESGGVAKSFSEQITFFGEAFDYMKAKFITNPNGKFEIVEITLIDDCCGEEKIVFEGAIFGNNVEWCSGDCFLRVSAVEFDDRAKQLDCLRSTLIYDNHDGFQQQEHPRMVYCNELRPNALQHITLIVGIILNLQLIVISPILTTIAVIVFVLNLVINAVNLIPNVNIQPINLDGNDQTTNLQTITNLLTSLNSFVIGCGRRHPSPLIREYIDNVCRKCGIEWESSIFGSPQSDYYNTVLYNAPIQQGKRPLLNVNNPITTWIDENKPIDTLPTLLDSLATVFNARWQVSGGVLRFERKDFFWDNAEWVNYEDLDLEGLLDGVICYSWRDEDAAAILRLSYQVDAVDDVGNEAIDRFNKLIEWNIPVSERQKGIEERLYPFGVARFRGDGIEPDILQQYAWFPAYTQASNIYSGVIIHGKGVAFTPKLLIWDGDSINFGKVKRYAIPGFSIDPLRNYNYPYNNTDFGAAPLTVYPSDEPLSALYKRFHAIDNPKVLNDKGKTFTFDFKFTCDHLSNFEVNKNIMTPIGSGRITTVQMNYTRRTAKVTGNV